VTLHTVTVTAAAAAADKPSKVQAGLLAAVAGGAFLGMIWPVVVALFRSLQPRIPIANAAAQLLAAAVTHSNAVLAFRLGGIVAQATKRGLAILLWLGLAAFIAAVITALNVVPMVTGANADKLKALGGWEYFFLAGEGFGLAAIFEQAIKPGP
jgi:hypothetical protein